MKFLKYGVLALVGLMSLNSCSDFLDQQPMSSLSQEQLFSDTKNMESYIQGLYKKWRDMHKERTDLYLGTDEASQGGVQNRDAYDKRQLDTYQDIQVSNGVVLNAWTKRFEVISGAAAMLQVKQNTVEEADSMTQVMVGEASFLRAASYFELAMMFGPVPLVDYLGDYDGTRQPLNKVYGLMESDLKRAIQYLPTMSEQSDVSRATTRLAWAMLGKLYMYAEDGVTRDDGSMWRDYQLAADAFKHVIDESGVGTTLPGTVDEIFGNTKDLENPTIPVEGSANVEKEWVYAFRFGHANGDENSCEWTMGSRAVSIMSTTGEAMCFWAGFDGMLPSEYCYKLKADGGVWDPSDARRFVSIRGINENNSEINTEEFNDPRNGWVAQIIGYCFGDELDPHSAKFEDPEIEDLGVNTYYSGRAIPFIRLGDIFLNYAECLYRLGETQNCLTYFNATRIRAMGRRGTLTAADIASEESFMHEMMDERMRELNFEGWRKFDLLRTGYLFANDRNGQPIMNRNKHFTAGTVNPNYKYWPIPLDEINKNIDLQNSSDRQNPGY